VSCQRLIAAIHWGGCSCGLASARRVAGKNLSRISSSDALELFSARTIGIDREFADADVPRRTRGITIIALIGWSSDYPA